MGLLRWRIVALASAIAALLAGGTWFALTRASAQGTAKDPAAHQAADRRGHQAPVQAVFSAPLAADSPMPTLTPAIDGSWQRVSPTTVQFVPARGFTAQTHVRLVIPAGPSGVRSSTGGLLAAQVVSKFWT